jgi:hypothetical protein
MVSEQPSAFLANLAGNAFPGTVVMALVCALVFAAEVRERLVSQGAEVYTMTPAELGRFFAQERKKWASVVQAGNIRLD